MFCDVYYYKNSIKFSKIRYKMHMKLRIMLLAETKSNLFSVRLLKDVRIQLIFQNCYVNIWMDSMLCYILYYHLGSIVTESMLRHILRKNSI